MYLHTHILTYSHNPHTHTQTQGGLRGSQSVGDDDDDEDSDISRRKGEELFARRHHLHMHDARRKKLKTNPFNDAKSRLNELETAGWRKQLSVKPSHMSARILDVQGNEEAEKRAQVCVVVECVVVRSIL
jgi:hypothetical protein